MTHPVRNGTLDVADLTAGSGRKIWWRCPAGDDHEWDAKVCNMTRPRAGCPYCAGRRIAASNRLTTTHPGLAAQWHPTRNGTRTAAEVSAGCNDRVWWRCPASSHEWQAQIDTRALRGNGCPYCANKKVSATNSLAAVRPDLILTVVSGSTRTA
ncbi:zinc-ribbon domain-containing protein [Nucisporomicrobium flavum]|uniref:zinc-ribbon domain-containing protein n=1 Tax=Nucisporomicrobium flavum TaxID=2785915 RepID=UPI003C2C9569